LRRRRLREARRAGRRGRRRRWHGRRLNRRLGRLRAARSVYPRAPRGFRLDLAHRFLERQPLPGDLGFLQRRLDPAQLRDQGRPRPFVQGTTGLAGILVETGYGTGNERVIVSHA
jgi:hypothetical protein